MGVLYFVSLPFIMYGMVRIVKTQKKLALLLFSWLLLAPVASALAVDAPNASRSMVFLPMWQIFAGFGILNFITNWKKEQVRTAATVGVLLLYLFNFLWYSHTYFLHTDLLSARDWQYGYKDAVGFASSVSPESRVFFAPDVEQPYIFYLFYTRKDPTEYIASGGSERIKKPCFSIETVYFGNCLKMVKSSDYIITQSGETTIPTQKIKEILYPDHEPALRIFKVK
jgi:hypothetical protein